MLQWLSRNAGPETDTAELTIRPAVPEDGEAVVAMARALSRIDGGRATRFSIEKFQRDGFGPEPAFSTLVAEQDGELTGYAIYYPGYDTDSATRGIYLADLYVREAFRRRGIGRALLRALAARARDEGARWMFWSVLKRNLGGRRFYQRLAQELRDVRLYAAFGRQFNALADAAASPTGAVKRPD